MSKHTVSPALVRFVVLLLLASLFAAIPLEGAGVYAQAAATCEVFQPSATPAKDAYIKQDNATERRGSDGELRVKTESGKLNRALLQFDLSSLPANSVVSSATLSLYVKDANGGAVTINARRVTAPWNEAQVTWNSRDQAASQLWSSPGGDYDGAVAASAIVDDTRNVWRSWTVTGLVAGWINDSSSNFGLILEAPVTNPKTEKKFKSSDDGTAAQRPKLEVCYSAAVTVEPSLSVHGAPGTAVVLPQIVRVGSISSAVNLSAGSSLGWDVHLYRDNNGNGVKDENDAPISATPSIGPNAAFPILVEVEVPVNALIGGMTNIVVTATAVSGGATDTTTSRLHISQAVEIEPNHFSYATAGGTAFYAHTITNNGADQDCVTVAATTSAGWNVTLWADQNANGLVDSEPQLSNPVCLAPGASAPLVAEVRVAGGAAAGVIGQTVISAASGSVSGVVDSAVNQTKVYVNNPPAVDGRADEVYRVSPDAQEVCYAVNGVSLGRVGVFAQTGGHVYAVLALDKSVVDNSYGANRVGWPNDHKLDDLDGSDYARFAAYDANGTEVLKFNLDYIDKPSGTPTGYASMGVSANEGKVDVGSAAHILEWGTSLDWSLNDSGYCANSSCGLLTTSPATDAFYTPNATYPNWVFDVVYEVKIDKAAFGAAGFGGLDLLTIHASPSKIGPTTISAEPTACPAELGDFVWQDLDGDGIPDGGEAGIDNIQLRLYKDNGDGFFDPADDILARTQTTAGGGRYLFSNLEANDYFVDVIDPTVPLGLKTTTYNDPSERISLAEGESHREADFGYLLGTTIGDVVWNDLNQNGVQDAGEPGVAGVTVKLLSGGGAVLGSTVTTTSGYFSFLNRPAGSFQLEFVPPDGYAFTASGMGGDPVRDSDANPVSGRTPVFTTAGGVSDLARDAGLIGTSTIGDFVWYDADGDGVQDIGEPGIANVTLDLYRNGVKTATATTGADGSYLFPALGPAAYVVDVTDAHGVLVDMERVIGNQSQPDPSTVVNLGAGERYADADFGYRQDNHDNAIVGGRVWYDADANGRYEPGEPGMAGVQVCAVPAAGGAGQICRSSDASGFYRIEVVAGAYTVSAAIPGSYSATTPTSHAAAVAVGEHYLMASFGFDNNLLGAIGDLVFLDANGNGVFDGADEPLPGISVDLIRDADNNGAWNGSEPIIATVYSVAGRDGSGGNYRFEGVPAGAYLVRVSDTAGVLSEYRRTTAGTPNTDGHSQAQPYRAVLIAPGSLTVATADFGYMASGGGLAAAAQSEVQGASVAAVDQGGPDAAIGNQVWVETDGDGVYDPADGDVGQAGITVDLYKDGNYWDKTTTGAGGLYAFTSLEAGNYSLVVSDDFNVLAAYRPTAGGPNPGVDGNNRPQPYAVALAGGDINFTADFGYIRTGALGDYVWYDSDADGVQDVGEPGIGNVTLDLFRGATKVASATTGADGGYLFANLAPGTYTVDVTDANGILTGLTHTTGAQSLADPTGSLTVVPAQVTRSADFGYVLSAGGNGVIGDRVWYDDGDGIDETTEPGITGVQVCAADAGGGSLCDTTDANGLYRIPAPAGVYTVTAMNPPAGLAVVGVNPLGPLALAAGEQSLAVDFGYTGAALHSIGGTVWQDGDGDGLLAAEAGLPGVTVDLIGDSDASGTWDTGEPILATAMADGSGSFAFPGLADGAYLVRVADTQNVLSDFVASAPGPSAGQDNNNQDQPYPVTLAGASDTTADFGYRPGASTASVGLIGNVVWYDVDGNGAYLPTAGDVGMAGVTVALIQNNVVIRTTTTGAGGNYVFTGLPPGSYSVMVTDDEGVAGDYLPTTLAVNPGEDGHSQAQPYVVALDAGELHTSADFGYMRPGAIGDLIWYDADGDGVQDVGEPGIGNVTLDLYRGGVKVATTKTGAGGGYLFGGLAPGVYSVDLTAVGGLLGGLTHIVFNQSQPDPSFGINLGAGEAYRDADFAFVSDPGSSAVIGDRVWLDANGNGRQEPGELNLAGVSVCVNGPGVSTCANTDANGSYRFTVPAGTYTVAATAPSGFSATTPSSQSVTVAGAEQSLTADFGFNAGGLGSAGNLVFVDANGDGSFNAGDAPLAGVSIDLIQDLNGDSLWTTDEPIVATVVSAGTLDGSGGNYRFGGLVGGSYLVYVSDVNAVLADYLSSASDASGTDNKSKKNPYPVGLAAGAANDSADFGYRLAARPHNGVIGNHVWYERDADGFYNPANGDLGQPGVTVELYRGGLYYGKTTSGPLGGYSFTGLPTGSYSVRVADDFNMLENYTPTHVPASPAEDSNVPQPYALSLAAGGYDLKADFGYVGLGIVRGFVFMDHNQDGQQGLGEPGLPGVELCLFADENADEVADSATPLMCTTTDASGLYRFEIFNISRTTHFVVAETDPAGLISTTDNQIPVVVWVTSGAGSSSDANFGDAFNVSFTLTKSPMVPGPFRTGELVPFRIRVVNTGEGTIEVLPLVDTFDSVYLAFLSNHAGNSPAPSGASPNQLVWSDITGAGNLATGAAADVVVYYVARADTSFLPGGMTKNTAAVQGGLADPDGPGGPLGAVAPLPPQSTTADVQINNPTGVWVTEAVVDLMTTRSVLRWNTVSEAELLGFNLLRSGGDDNFVRVNPETIAAAHSGTANGASYEWVDQSVVPEARYRYQLAILLTDGRTITMEFVPLTSIINRQFLPMVDR